jgi:putative intracellular protease/amidase
MMKKVYVLVFDGLADWEVPLALCEIRNSGKYEVVTVGFTGAPVTTMAGLKLVPDIALAEVNSDDAAMLILPGGEMWEAGSPEGVCMMLESFQARGVPVAAICGATLEVVRAGLTEGRRHTSSDKGYVEAVVPGYRDGALYVNELAVTDDTLITASGVGSVEFAREITRYLGIYTDEQASRWFDLYKHGVWSGPI